jgi:hypothetical protein
MSLVVLESRNSADSVYPIWSGVTPFILSYLKLYTNTFDTYICGPYTPFGGYLLRINTYNGLYNATEVRPPVASGLARGLSVSHYWGESGYAVYSAAVETSGNKTMFSTTYPEILGGWTTCTPISGIGNPIDIVFPDTPNSPRFLIGINTPNSQHVEVVLADDPELVNRYPTDWSALDNTGSVTDLECMRFI